jgi:hypothetical protein
MTKNIDPQWVAWAKQQVTLLKNGGYMIFPSDGAIFQVNKEDETLTLVCCRPTFIGGDTEDTNSRVFAKIGYRYVRPDDVPTDVESMFKRILGHPQKYASDIPTLIEGLCVIFRLGRDEFERKINTLGKLPINPVTIRGDASDEAPRPKNLTIGRLWIGNDTIPDAPRRFNLEKKRGPQWEKPITLVIWRDNEGMKHAKGMMVDEEDFVPAVKRLQTQDEITLKLWGKPNRHSEEKWSVVFRRSPHNKTMLVTFYPGVDMKTEAASAAIDFAKFIDGLGHLFPNGELA